MGSQSAFLDKNTGCFTNVRRVSVNNINRSEVIPTYTNIARLVRIIHPVILLH